MEEVKILYEDLSPEEKTALEKIYGKQIGELHGYSSNEILYVRNLSAEEKELFSNRPSSGNTASLRQILYKIKGNLLPPKFTVTVNRAFQQEDVLKTNYVVLDGRILAVVRQNRNKTPEIAFNNLSAMSHESTDMELRKKMEAELRKEFDITFDPLMRFSIFHTADDEYGVIVTAVEAVLLNYDVRNIFREVMNLPDIQESISLADGVPVSKLAAPIKEYWVKMLSDLPKQAPIPHISKDMPRKNNYQENNYYLAHIPRDILSDLKGIAESNKLLLMSILQTAWGFLLQDNNNCLDVSFCLLVPRKEKGKYAFGTSSTVPVRLKVEEDYVIRDIITAALKQFVISQPYASLGRKEIMELMGQKKEGFDHFLNFYDFLVESEPYSEVEGTPYGTVVSQNIRDVRDIKLGISFRQGDGDVIMSLHYNNLLFPRSEIKLLVEHYFLVLQQILTDWNSNFQTFMENLRKHWQAEMAAAAFAGDDSQSIIQDGLSKLLLFQQCESGVIQLFTNKASLYTKFEGDRISGKEIEQNLVFVLQGKVVRNVEIGDGWYNTLDILKENSWVNENVMLPERKVNVSAEVLTEQATIMMIPLSFVYTALGKSAVLGKNIIYHTLKQLEKYQRLWIQG